MATTSSNVKDYHPSVCKARLSDSTRDGVIYTMFSPRYPLISSCLEHRYHKLDTTSSRTRGPSDNISDTFRIWIFFTERLDLVRFLILVYISTRGRTFVHVRPVSSQHFASLVLSVLFSRSTAPPLAGWYAQCVRTSIPRWEPSCLTASFTKCLPLSLEILLGIPHCGIMSLNNALVTTLAVCF